MYQGLRTEGKENSNNIIEVKKVKQGRKHYSLPQPGKVMNRYWFKSSSINLKSHFFYVHPFEKRENL